MAADPFVAFPDPIFARFAEPRPVDDKMRSVGVRLLAAAVEAGAYGLAATHIGEVEPVVVVNLGTDTAPDYRLFYNPVVAATADEYALGREASVSLPGVEAEISRPVWAEIAFDDDAGTRLQQRFDGFVARCLLHEIEQMNGRFYLMKLSRLKREALVKKAAKRAKR